MTQTKKILSSTGQPMLSAKAAAKRLSCAPDYVGKLCREGKLVGIRENNAWFVDPASVASFETARAAAKAERSKELSAIRKQESMQHQQANSLSVSSHFEPTRPSVPSGFSSKHFALAALASFFVGAAVVGASAIMRGTLAGESRAMSAALAQVESPFFGTGAQISLPDLGSSLLALFGNLFGNAPKVAGAPVPTVEAREFPVTVASATSSAVVVAGSNAQSSSTSPASRVVQNVYPIRERVIERVVTQSGITQEMLSASLEQLENEIRSELYTNLGNLNSFPSSGGVLNSIALSQHISKLSGVTITNSTIEGYLPLSGGSLSGAISVGSGTSTFSGGLSVTGGCVSVNGVCIGSGGAGNPGGSDTQVQFNDGGVFNGDAGFVYNSAADRLTVTFASTTALSASYASSTNLYAGNLTLGNALGVAQGGTGLAMSPSYGQVLVGNSSGGFDLVATSSLGIVGGSGGAGFSTTSADYWSTTKNFAGFSTTSADYWSSLGLGFSTTSAAFWASTNNFTGFSTTSAAYWASVNNFAGFSTTSADYWSTTKNFAGFSTTSANHWLSLGASTTQLSILDGLYIGRTSTTSIFGSATSTFAAGLIVSGGGLRVSTLTSAACDLKADINGNIYCGLDSTATGAADPFVFTQHFGAIAAATSSTIWAQGGIFASSTSRFDSLYALAATTSALAVTGSTTISGQLNAVGGATLGNATIGSLTLGTALSAANGGTGSTTLTGLLVGNGTGAVQTATISSPLTLSGTTLALAQAGVSSDGYLSSPDWNSFNARLSTSTLGLFDKGYFFSTTSASNFVHASTTIPKTYSTNTFTGANSFNGGLTASSFTLGTLNGPLQANSGVVSATTSIGVLYGGTGLTVAPSYGQLLVGNGAGYSLFATSTLGLLGSTSLSAGAGISYDTATGLISNTGVTALGPVGQTLNGNLTIATSTATNNGITSSITVTGAGNTLTFAPSQTGTLSAAGGGTGSTTLTGLLVGNGTGAVQTATISSPLTLSGTTLAITQATNAQNGYLSSTDWNLFNNKVSSSSLASSIAAAFPFTSTTNFGALANATSTAIWFQNGLQASSTSRFADLTVQTASTTNLAVLAVTSALLKTNSLGQVVAAIPGTDYVTTAQMGAAFAWTPTLFGSSNANATSTLIGFNAGLYTLASSTIGSGTQAGGLTVSGGATTTGTLYVAGTGTSTFRGDISITGHIVPTANNVYSLGAPDKEWHSLFIGPGSLYVNGQKVISTNGGDDVVISSDPNENLVVQTSGTANIELNPAGGQVQIKNTINLTAGKSITTTDLSALPVPNGVAAGNITIASNSITASNLNGGISLTPNGSGGTYITTGNFGVGTTSPAQKLSVSGNAYITGALTLGSALGVGSGGTGTSTAPSYGQLLLGNALGGYDLVATSTLGIASFSTTSAAYWASVNNFAGFSTTSAAYFVHSSTTIPKTYTSNTFSGANTFNGSFTLGTLNGPLQANNGVVSATTSIGVLYGGTGLTVAPSYGQLLIGNGSGGYTFTSTSTLGLSATDIATGTLAVQYGGTGVSSITGIVVGNGTTPFSSITDSLGLRNVITDETGTGALVFANAPSLVSPTVSGLLAAANASTSQLSVFNRAYFGGTATSTFDSAGVLTLATALAAGSGGTGISNVSAGGVLVGNYAGTGWQQLATSSLGLLSTNVAEGSNLYYTPARVQTYLDGLDKGYYFSTTSANYYAHSSTTIAKTYLANTFSAINTFAALTNLSGFISSASSTIGNGSQTGGLTVSGGATTTGSVYVGGNLGVGVAATDKNLDIAGTARISSTLTLSGSAACTGGQALQTNGSGDITCGTITTAGVSTAGGWTTDNLGQVFLATTTDRVGLGATSTPYAKLSILSGAPATTTLALVPALAQTANILDIYNTSGALSTVLTANGYFGLGTTTPSATLSVEGSSLLGNSAIAGYFVATTSRTNIFPYASSTALSVAGAAYFGSATTTGLNVSGATRLEALPSGLLSTNASGVVQLTSVSQPLSFSGSTLSLNVGSGLTTSGGNLVLNMSSANNWLALQTFSGGASTTALSSLDGVFVGRTSTTSIRGDGLSSIIPFASSTALTVSGTGYFGNLLSNASSTIGNGTRGGGLTISGGATTTGVAYFAGNVGIGTSSPGAALQIGNGTNSYFSSFFNNSDTAASFGFANSSRVSIITNAANVLGFGGQGSGGISLTGNYVVGGGTANQLLLNPTLGAVGVGSSTLSATFAVHNNNGSTYRNVFAVGSSTANSTSTLFVVTNAGSVGVGTAAPGKALDVVGTGRFSGTLTLSTAASCTGQQALQTDVNGDVACGTVNLTGITSAGGWTTDTFGSVFVSTSTDRVGIGATSTPYAKLSVLSGGAGTTTLALVPSSGQTANIIDIYNTTGSLASVLTAAGNFGLGTAAPSYRFDVSGDGRFTGLVDASRFVATSTTATSTFAGLVGIGSTTPAGKLGVQGNLFISGNISNVANITATGTLSIGGAITSTATSANTLPFASTTALTVSGNSYLGIATSTSINANTATIGAITAGSLSIAGAITSTAGSATTLPYASSTALTVSGVGYFGTASTTNLTISGLLANRVPYITTGGVVTSSSNLTFNGTTLAANALTLSNALGISSGGTNATSFTTAGNAVYYDGTRLVSAGNSPVTIPFASTTALTVNGNAYINDIVFSQGSTTLQNFTFGLATGTAATTTHFYSSVASSSRLFAGSASIASLTLGNALSVTSGGSGANSLTGILIGNGTSPFTTVTDSLGLSNNLSDEVGSGSLVFNNAPYFTGNVGIGTSSPFAQLSLHATSTTGIGASRTLFALASSTGGTATSTLFSVSNTGLITGGAFSFANGTTTALSVAGIASTSQLVVSGNANINGSLTVGGIINLLIASTSQLSVFNRAYFGGTATTTIDSAGNLFVAGSSTIANAFNAIGGATIGPVTFAGRTSTLLSTNASGALQSTTVNSPLTFSGSTLSIDQSTSGQSGFLTSTDWNTFNNKISSTSLSGVGPITYDSNTGSIGFNTAVSNTFTGLQRFLNASSTLFSVTGTAYFGGTATTTIDAAGNLAVAGNFTGAGLSSCASGQDKLVWTGGQFACAFDAGANGTEFNWTFFNGSGVRLGTTTNQVVIGATATSSALVPTARFNVIGGAGIDFATTTALFATTASSTNLSVGENAIVYGNLGVGSSSPYAKLSVTGGSIVHTATGTPILATSTTSAGNTYASAVQGRYVYVADNIGGLKIYDHQTPQRLTLVGSYTGISGAVAVAVAGKYAYVGDISAGLVIVDVSNPSNPVQVGSYPAGDTYGIALSGKYAFVGNLSGGSVQVIDVSNPANPVLASTISTGGAPYGLYAQGRYLYVASQASPKFRVVDISNPAQPALVGSLSTGLNFPTSVTVSGRYAYIGDATRGLQIIDVSNPAAPSITGSFEPGAGYYGVAIAGTYAYAADHSGKVKVIDVSNPAAPRGAGILTLPGGLPQGITVMGKYAYVANDDQGLAVVDISGLETPSANIGSLAAGSANISDDLSVGNNIFAGGGLNVGISGIFSRGTISAYVASSTQVNPVVANFMGGNVGIGTSSPFAALAVVGSGYYQGNATTTGAGYFGNGITVSNADSALAGYIGFGNGAATIGYDGSNFTISGGALFTSGSPIIAQATNSSLGLGARYQGAGGTVYFGAADGTGTPDAVISNNAGTELARFTNAGNFGLGTTSPYANLSVHAKNGSTNTMLFAIGSSTANSTTTLFSVDNQGNATIAGSLTVANFSPSSLTLASVGRNMILTADGSGNLVASSTPTAAAYFATSTTVASVFSGGFTAYASSTIGNGAQDGGLTVNGGATTTGAAYIAGNVNLSQFASYLINGSNALYASTTNNSVAVGPGAGYRLSSIAGATYNVALGSSALTNGSLTGDRNNALGAQSLYGATSGSENQAVGVGALFSLTDGWDNVAVGDNAGYNNGSGDENVYAGSDAGRGASGQGHNGNVGIGYRSLYNISGTSGGYNTTLGYLAGYGITSGSNNVILGTNTTNGGITSGSSNILIGQDVQAGLSSTGSNQLNVGNVLFGTGVGSGTTVANAKLGVASTSPFSKFAVHANNGDTGTTVFAIGSSTANSTTTLFSVSNTGSTTLSRIPSALLKTDSSGTIIAAVPNVDYSTFAFPYTATTNFGAAANSTSSRIWFTNGLQASSTSHFAAAAVYGTLTMGSTGTSFALDQGGAIEMKATNNTSSPYFDWGLTGRDYDFRQQIDLANNNFNIMSSSTASILTLKGNGNVGIGTTNPTQKLYVAGNVVGTNIMSVNCQAGYTMTGFDASGNIVCSVVPTASTTGSAVKMLGFGNERGTSRFTTYFQTSDGKIFSAGYNGNYELGNGDPNGHQSNTPKSIALPPGKFASSTVAAGYGGYAVMTDGTVYAWGYNANYGALGVGDTTGRSIPTQVLGLTNVKKVAVSSENASDNTAYHACAVTTLGQLYCWGYNGYGQVGNYSTGSAVSTPVQVATTTGFITDVKLADDQYGHTCITNSNKDLWCWGYNGYGQLGDSSQTNRSFPKLVSTSTSGLASSTEFFEPGAFGSGGYTCAINTARNLYCWGYNGYGNLGLGDTTLRTTPRPVPNASSTAKVFMGGGQYLSTFYTTLDGKLYAAGYNGYGQLGDYGTTQRTTFVPSATTTGSITQVEMISTGSYGNTCVLNSIGLVYCFGYGGTAQLGYGGTAHRYGVFANQGGNETGAVPGLNNIVQIGGTGISNTGEYCALSGAGLVYCWGYNDTYGEIGIGQPSTSWNNANYVGTPTQVLIQGSSNLGYWDKKDANLYYLQGNVGIGTTTAQGKLTIVGTGIGNNSSFLVTDQNQNTTFTVLDNGRVGVGTTTPYAKLSVAGAAVAEYFVSTSTSAVNLLPILLSTSATTTNLAATNLNLGSFSGLLQAVNGQVSATTTLSSAYGGTGFSSYSSGDILYAGSNGLLTRLPKGSDGQVLKLTSGLPSWAADSTGGSGTGVSPWATTTNSGAIYPADTTDVVVVGSNATTTTTNILEVYGNSYFSGNVGVGSTSPWAKFSINSSSLGAAPAFAIGSSTGTQFVVSNGGRVGIGTSTPYAQLGVNRTASTPQLSLAYDATTYTDFRTDATGNLWVLPVGSSGGNVYMPNDNLYVCSGGSITSNACPTGSPSGAGNLVVSNRVGIGTSTPNRNLNIAGTRPSIAITDTAAGTNLKHWVISSMGGNLYIGTSTDAYATTTAAALTLGSNGRVGVGTSTPTKQLSVADLLFVGANGTTSMGVATSTFMGDIRIIGKLDVQTIDPVYTIDGVKYATYGHSTIGIFEETLQTIALREKDATGKYAYRIAFDELEKGSDLWLFYQVTTFGAEWNDLVVSLTPSFDGAVFYEKDKAGNALVIRSDRAGEVSMRLTAARYDSEKWPNLRPDQHDREYLGHEVQSKPAKAAPATSAGEAAARLLQQ